MRMCALLSHIATLSVTISSYLHFNDSVYCLPQITHREGEG